METETKHELTSDLINRCKASGPSGRNVALGALTAVALASPEDFESMKRAAAYTMSEHIERAV